MEMGLAYTLERLIVPPGGPLLLVTLGTLLLWARRRSGYLLLSLGWVLLYFTSIPFTAFTVMHHLESPPLTAEGLAASNAQAIVVLAYRRYHDAPEYGGDTAGAGEFERLRYAAHLQRLTALPLTVIGGDAFATGTAEAELMRRALEEELKVPVTYLDGRSRNTADNARYAHELLAPKGIERILLVSHAWHLPRAAELFAAQGFSVTPAPTGFTTREPLDHGWRLWLPAPRALEQNQRALHELLGWLAVELRTLQGEQ